jgi:hypothetical protein
MRHALSTVMLRARSDQALVALAREGDESAFTVLVERYRGSLLALARRLGDASRAEDAVQQGLMCRGQGHPALAVSDRPPRDLRPGDARTPGGGAP